MPIWRSSRGDVRFPFDPRIIAGLLSRGESVTADEGLTPEELEAHRALITEQLQKFWGEGEVGKTIQKRRGTMLPPSFIGDSGFIKPPPLGTPFRQMIPNPLFPGTMERIERPRKPKLLEAGLGSDIQTRYQRLLLSPLQPKQQWRDLPLGGPQNPLTDRFQNLSGLKSYLKKWQG